LELIRWQVQTRLHERVVEHRVVFAAGHEREAYQIREHRPGAILAIESQQGAFLRKLVCSQIPTQGRERLSQFLPLPSIAPVAKRAQPTFNCEPGS
jgi:hypothetical protein